MRVLILILAGVSLSAAPAKETFTGTISDELCGRDGHAGMRMGPTDAECARMCVLAHGSAYVLDDGKVAYKLSDQKLAADFPAQKVQVVGTLDAKTKTIHVESIKAAR